MWKWIPFLSLVVIMGCCGILLANNLKQRRKELEQFLIGIRVMGSEIRYTSSPLYLCFQRAGESVKTKISDVFLKTSELLKENGNGESSFLTAINAYREDLALTEADIEKTKRFAFRLGTADMEHSLNAIHRMEEQLSMSLSESVEIEKKWGNVFRNGGWLTGFAAALIFL